MKKSDVIMTDRLEQALAKVAEMEAPSVEDILRHRDYQHEANAMHNLVLEYRRAKDAIECWCGMVVAKDRSHYPGNDPEDGPAHKPSKENPNLEPQDGDDRAAQCYECGEWTTDIAPEEEGWLLGVTVDGDPGDPEVGPRPHLITVDICPKCRPKYEAPKTGGRIRAAVAAGLTMCRHCGYPLTEDHSCAG